MDRNDRRPVKVRTAHGSLSARRAWIEIFDYIIRLYRRIVALRKESVDRNVVGDVMGKALAGRSPQGERG